MIVDNNDVKDSAGNTNIILSPTGPQFPSGADGSTAGVVVPAGKIGESVGATAYPGVGGSAYHIRSAVALTTGGATLFSQALDIGVYFAIFETSLYRVANSDQWYFNMLLGGVAVMPQRYITSGVGAYTYCGMSTPIVVSVDATILSITGTSGAANSTGNIHTLSILRIG